MILVQDLFLHACTRIVQGFCKDFANPPPSNFQDLGVWLSGYHPGAKAIDSDDLKDIRIC